MAELRMLRVSVQADANFIRIGSTDGDHVWLWLEEDAQGAEFDVCITEDNPDYGQINGPRFRMNETRFIRFMDRVLDSQGSLIEEQGVTFPTFERQVDEAVIAARAPCGEARDYTVSELEGVLDLLPELTPLPPGCSIGE